MDALGKIFFLALGINGVHELPAGEDEHGKVYTITSQVSDCIGCERAYSLVVTRAPIAP
jgi:hypothetical protein